MQHFRPATRWGPISGIDAMTYMLMFKRYAPFETFGGGFEGDTRTEPSANRRASARTIGVVDFTSSSVSSVMLGYSSGTRWRKDAKYSYSKVATSISVKTRGSGIISFTAYTAGSNPCVPAAPDIDTFVDLVANFSSHSIVFSGKVRGDDFPNAEVWVYDNVGPANAALLFDYRTKGGQNTGPLGLFGSGSDNVLGDIYLNIPIEDSGSFSRKLTK